MSITTIQDILPLVEQPSRYLGSEINTIKKDHRNVKLCFALAFPDLYEIGTSHFGLQILYQILNRHREIAAERVFAPGIDMEILLRSSGIPIMSLESHKPLDRFDIIGFSLLYELNYTNILTMLELAHIPFFTRQRDDSHPFVIAGGPCTCNPEPVADFFDAIVVGDGEKVITEMSRAWLTWKASGKSDKKTLLRSWSYIEGVYIPLFFKPKYDENGFQSLVPEFSDYNTVKRAIVDDLDHTDFPDAPIIPYGKPVHDRLRIEVSRGCTRGCRFCQAGMIYRPVRERSLKTLLSLSDACIASTGYEDISLLSLSTGDYECIFPLMKRLIDRYKSRRIAVSLPSLRVGTLTPELMQLVKKVRKTGFTIAPEAGSQRLRDVINKNIAQEEIENTVKNAFSLGWQVIKLYFMIGLPTETNDDLQAIVDLVKKLRKIKGPNGRKGKLNVSVATFIPKSHTPFQWASQISLADSKQKMRWLKKNLKMPGVQFKWQSPEVSMLEGLWARGDRRLSRLLLKAYRKGCKFDGWSDKFKYQFWHEALCDEGVDIDFYTTRVRDTAEPLPWDYIDTKVTKDFLKYELKKAEKGECTVDCRTGECNNCGVCDFKIVGPKVFDNCEEGAIKNIFADDIKERFYKKLKMSFSKRGTAKYFGHLELVRIFLRAISRAGIPIKFSEGFHPKPKISFEDPLPVGLESLNENFYLSLRGDVKPQSIIAPLNKHLPKGLNVLNCQLASTKPVSKALAPATYIVTKKDGFFDEKELNCFIKKRELIVTRTGPKGKTKKIDLKKMVLKIELTAPNRLKMTLRTEPGRTVRPLEVIEKIFCMPVEEIKQAAIVKL
ncbi:MAG: TIGR03960 family B12-binding radical SAM protein [Thermodesulfobacteriota bacterium]|nr:TIGR03960 family B12-binding radical SAM protein [Thermodesulfobacteriota bacterium]